VAATNEATTLRHWLATEATLEKSFRVAGFRRHSFAALLLRWLSFLLQNKAAAASDNPEAAANVLSVYDYKQQQVGGTCVYVWVYACGGPHPEDLSEPTGQLCSIKPLLCRCRLVHATYTKHTVPCLARLQYVPAVGSILLGVLLLLPLLLLLLLLLLLPLLLLLLLLLPLLLPHWCRPALVPPETLLLRSTRAPPLCTPAAHTASWLKWSRSCATPTTSKPARNFAFEPRPLYLVAAV
jgi:hypothetical protein